jgi:hypothetical protein
MLATQCVLVQADLFDLQDLRLDLLLTISRRAFDAVGVRAVG